MPTSQVAYQAGTYPSLCSLKQLGVFLLAHGWNASPSQGYPQYYGYKYKVTNVQWGHCMYVIIYKCCFVSYRTWTLKDICYTLSLPPMDDNLFDTVSTEEFKLIY